MTDAPTWYEVDPMGRYRYRLTETIHFIGIRRHPAGTVEIQSANPKRQRLGILEHTGVLTMFPGYASDGATSAPDVQKLMRAIFLHDILCQCCTNPDWHMTRFECDREFLTEGIIAAPIRAKLYYGFIRVGGGLHQLFNLPSDEEKVRIVAL
jgi:hypothetical protein